MKILFKLIILFILLISFTLNTQEFTISGTLIDSSSQKTLEAATVYADMPG